MPTASPDNHSVADDLTAADYEALAAFRHGLRRFLAFSETGVRTAGLTPQQHQALLVIKAHGIEASLSIGDLADQLLIKNHSAVELVARLVKAGLVTRHPSPADRRRVLLLLTPSGSTVLATISRNNLRELRLISPAFAGILRRLDKASRS